MPDAIPTDQRQRPPFACIALLFQGGGALGAYQAGIYQGLSEAELALEPDWIAGISVGAINAALIVGNAPGKRVERLREFWQGVTASSWYGYADALTPFIASGDARSFFNQANAAQVLVGGVPGFFEPRLDPPWLYPQGGPGPTSYYDTKPLRATLERLVDFDRINTGPQRFSVGAVNIRTGNFVYFDNTIHRIGPEHIMASGALPPGFPPVEIEGEFYWDGGLVSNTPLHWVLECGACQDTLAFQVDLWSAPGKLPTNMAEVMLRQKEIQYSSRTREDTDRFAEMQKLRRMIAAALDKLPGDIASLPEVAPLRAVPNHAVYNIVHLIYRSKHYEGEAKDYEFSRLSMEEHWQAGYHDAVATLRHKEIFERPAEREGVFTYDIGRDGSIARST
jgi:NTE family protein